MLIAIDTATDLMAVALHDGDKVLYEQNWIAGKRHTVDLAPMIHQMLQACDVALDDLIGLAVCIGPGSYTGVRIGTALAKGMAAPRGLPLVGIDSLDILAAGQPYYQSGTGLVAVVAAGRGRVIVRSYRWRKGEWNSRAEPRLMEWDALLSTIDGAACITGEINQHGMEAIRAAQSADLPITIAPAANRMRRAGYLAEIGWQRLHKAGGDLSAFAAEKLLPIYVKSDDKK